MADADALQFRITARNEADPVFRKLEETADRAQARFSGAATRAKTRVTAEARSARSAFSRMAEPVRQLSPEFERVHSTLERMGKTSRAVQSVFGSTRATAAKSAKEQSATLAKMRQEAERGAHGAANKAAERVASRFGLGRFTGTDEIKEVGSRYFGGEREAAAPETMARAQRDESHAYESAFKQHMSDAERAIGDTAKGFGEAGVAAEGAEAGVGALVGTIGGLALAAVAAGVAVEVMAAKVSSKFARTGQSIENNAMMSGLDPTVLQRWRGAAERSGVDPAAAEQALGGFGMKLHNLSYGMGDAGTANMLAQMHIAVPKAGEAVDVDALTKQALDKIAAIKDPFTKLNTANALGLGALVPMTRSGAAGVTADQAAYDKTGGTYTREDLDKADAQARRLTDFDQSKRGFMKRAGSVATDISAPGLGVASAAVQTVDVSKVGDLFKGMIGSAGGASGAMNAVTGSAQGAAKALGGLTRGAGRAVEAVVAPRAEAATPEAAQAPGQVRSSRPIRGPGWMPTADRRRRQYHNLTPEIARDIDAGAANYGINPELMTAVSARETAGTFDPKITPYSRKQHRNLSSAVGLYQFTEQTWLDVLKRHGGDQGVGLAAEAAKITYNANGGRYSKFGAVSPGEEKRLLDLRKDPRIASLMGAAYMADNRNALQTKIGRAPTDDESYLTHFLGPGDAQKFVQKAAASPHADAAQGFPEAASANPGVFHERSGRDRSYEEVLQDIARTISGAIQGGDRQKLDVQVTVVDGKVTKATQAAPRPQKVASTR